MVNHGNFATVWQGKYQESVVAVKVFPAGWKQKFTAEKEVYEQPLMKHAGIVHFLGSGRKPDGDSWFIVLQFAEYVRGNQSLLKILIFSRWSSHVCSSSQPSVSSLLSPSSQLYCFDSLMVHCLCCVFSEDLMIAFHVVPSVGGWIYCVLIAQCKQDCIMSFKYSSLAAVCHTTLSHTPIFALHT